MSATGGTGRVVQIRRKRYRGKYGWLVLGYAKRQRGEPFADWWHVSIFTETRTSAEKIRKRVKAGEDVQLADFEP